MVALNKTMFLINLKGKVHYKYKDMFDSMVNIQFIQYMDTWINHACDNESCFWEKYISIHIFLVLKPEWGVDNLVNRPLVSWIKIGADMETQWVIDGKLQPPSQVRDAGRFRAVYHNGGACSGACLAALRKEDTRVKNICIEFLVSVSPNLLLFSINWIVFWSHLLFRYMFYHCL